MANGVNIGDVAERARSVASQVEQDVEEKASEQETVQAAQRGTEIAQADPQAGEVAVEQVTQQATAQLPPEQKAEIQEQLKEDQQTGQISDVTRAILGFAPIALGFAAGGAAGGAAGARAGAGALQRLGDEDRARLKAAEKQAKLDQDAKIKADQRKSDEQRRKEELELKQTNALALLDARSADAKELEQLRATNRRSLKKITKKEPKSSQFEAAQFGQRLLQAESNFSELESRGLDATSIGFAVNRALPELFKGDDTKRQEQAERNFVNAVLRRESGAAIAESEFESAKAQYFPTIGDGPEVLAQKRANRQIAISALRAEAGAAFEQVGQPQVRGAPSQLDPLAGKFSEKNNVSLEEADRILKLRRAKRGG